MHWELGLIVVTTIAALGGGSYWFGVTKTRRGMRRLVKRRDGAPHVEDFVMQPGEGAMEIVLSKRAYKNLRKGPIEGLIIGSKDQMVLRLKIFQ